MAPIFHEDGLGLPDEVDESYSFDELSEGQLRALQGIKPETDTGDQRLGPYIASLFERLEGHPDAFKGFFDPAVRTFKFLRFHKDGKGCNMLLPVMTWRKCDVVIAGFHET
ncbi:hypothetical protein EJ02DRAFT_417373 [Clathrospora elynae]|uniref:Uncharacterized protein n=1 Tax=Clathrospora elynae TaxID=706981 RepID=A0A6A5TG76_9PLEO|nr:hypothetical protein EJ02DRAFT_417373 [Clathrospora elynae]